MLHQFYNTPAHGGSLRSYYLGCALVQQGYRVVVITTHNQPHALITEVEGMEVHYLPVAYDNRYGFFRRAFSFIRFISAIVREASRVKDARLCYAISAPLTTGLAAIWLKWRYGIPYVFEVGDLWPEAPIQLGVVRHPLLKQLLFNLERNIYRKAQTVVALSEAIEEDIRSRFPRVATSVIPNMADTEFFAPGRFPQAFTPTNPFIIVYAGTLGMANGLDFLLWCAQACARQNLPVHVVICGKGAERERLQRFALERSLPNVTFTDFQSREGVRNVLQAADAVLVCYKPLPVLQTGSPNKYFDGLAAGRLMIVTTRGWMKEEVERQHCGFYADPAQPDTFPELLKPFLDVAVLRKAQQASRALAERHYSRKALGEKFVQLINTHVTPAGG